MTYLIKASFKSELFEFTSRPLGAPEISAKGTAAAKRAAKKRRKIQAKSSKR